MYRLLTQESIIIVFFKNKILQKSTKFLKIDKIVPKKNNIITMQRYFFVLEILDKQAFNQAPFNPVLFLSVLRIQ